jgi:hypothetical protein
MLHTMVMRQLYVTCYSHDSIIWYILWVCYNVWYIYVNMCQGCVEC